MKTREEIEAMGDEERRIKTAELCGWTSIQNWTGFRNKELAARNDYTDVPDYLNSLDAMHAAEVGTFIEGGMWSAYYAALSEVCNIEDNSPMSATARQRNCAFLMTML